MLVLPSDLYSELESILVDVCSTFLIYLILSTNYLTTDYYSKKLYINILKKEMPILNSILRASTVWTNYKYINSIKLLYKKLSNTFTKDFISTKY